MSLVVVGYKFMLYIVFRKCASSSPCSPLLTMVTALAYVRGFIWSPTCQHCSSWCIAPGQRHDPPDEPLICFRIGRLTTESSFVKKSSNCFISSTSSNVGVLFGGIMSVLILGIVRRSSLGDDLVCLQ